MVDITLLGVVRFGFGGSFMILFLSSTVRRLALRIKQYYQNFSSTTDSDDWSCVASRSSGRSSVT